MDYYVNSTKKVANLTSLSVTDVSAFGSKISLAIHFQNA